MDKLLIIVTGLLLAWLSPVSAQEARCAAIEAGGGTCVCAESMNTANSTSALSYTSLQYAGSENTTKRCVHDNFLLNGNPATPATWVQSVGNDCFFQDNKAEIMSALPPGRTQSLVLRRRQGTWNTGGGQITPTTDGPAGCKSDFSFGPLLTSAQGAKARVAIRWYTFYSSNYEWQNGDTGNPNLCNNSGKIMETQAGISTVSVIIQFFGGTSPSNWYGWQVSSNGPWTYLHSGSPQTVIDCCSVAPGFQTSGAQALSNAYWRGKWVRFEMVWRNNTGSRPFIWQLYAKNVTTPNEPEYLIMDSSQTCTFCGTFGTGPAWNPNNDWTTELATTLGPPNGQPYLYPKIDFFRRDQCQGYDAWARLLVASWDTDNNQRIGAASEIEGALGPTTPGTPASLSVVKLSSWAIEAIRGY